MYLWRWGCLEYMSRISSDLYLAEESLCPRARLIESSSNLVLLVVLIYSDHFMLSAACLHVNRILWPPQAQLSGSYLEHCIPLTSQWQSNLINHRTKIYFPNSDKFSPLRPKSWPCSCNALSIQIKRSSDHLDENVVTDPFDESLSRGEKKTPLSLVNSTRNPHQWFDIIKPQLHGSRTVEGGGEKQISSVRGHDESGCGYTRASCRSRLVNTMIPWKWQKVQLCVMKLEQQLYGLVPAFMRMTKRPTLFWSEYSMMTSRDLKHCDEASI